MKERIISALVLLPLLLCVYFGGYPLQIVVFIISLLGLKEFYDALRKGGYVPCDNIGRISLLLLFLILYIGEFNYIKLNIWIILVIMASLIYGMVRDEGHLVDAFGTITGILYVPFLLYHLVLLDVKFGQNPVWLVILISFGSDIFAYFSGTFFGKHKLCEKISPKKTIEGAIGGVFGSILLSVIFSLIVWKEVEWYIILIAIFGSIFSQLGDLVASSVKRKVGIKDYSNLIPGHGGILDRFDSVIFVSPVVYILAELFLG